MALDGLVIDEPWIEMILSGAKIWEMRSKATNTRGPIALIKKGSGTVVGTAVLVDSHLALTREEMSAHETKHRISKQIVDQHNFKWFTPWELSNVRRLTEPVPYRHRRGAVIWVKLDAEVEKKVALPPKTKTRLPPGRERFEPYPRANPIRPEMTGDEVAKRLAELPHIGGKSYSSITDSSILKNKEPAEILKNIDPADDSIGSVPIPRKNWFRRTFF